MRGMERDMVSETESMFQKHAKMEEEERMRPAEENEKMEDKVGKISARMSGSENV